MHEILLKYKKVAGTLTANYYFIPHSMFHTLQRKSSRIVAAEREDGP